MADNVPMTNEQVRDAQKALDIAAMNGILSIVMVLKKRNLMTNEEAVAMHESMTKALSWSVVANNPSVQDAQHHLDLLFSQILQSR